MPKIVSLSPPVEAAAGLVPNRATIEDIEAALLRAPNLLARLGLHSEDGRTLPLEQLGLGHYAHAFLLPSGLVLKVTDDEDDARVCKMVMDLANGKPGLPFIEAVYRLPGDVYENETDEPFERPLFAIVMEPVAPASKAGLSRTRSGEVRGRLLGEAVLYPSMEAELATDEARAFAKTIRRGVHWLAQHGVSVVDLHHNNFGYASGKRPVIIDFGHGSLHETFEMRPIQMASNPAQEPTERQVLGVWRAIGSPDVDMDELRMGIEVEQEHGVDMREAGKIAMDHLREFPDYYTRLTKMEARAKAGLAPNAKKPVDLDKKLAALRWGARWLYADDDEMFVEGCGDVAYALAQFAAALGLSGVKAVSGSASVSGEPALHAWVEVDGRVYDPRADVEKIGYKKHQKSADDVEAFCDADSDYFPWREETIAKMVDEYRSGKPAPISDLRLRGGNSLDPNPSRSMPKVRAAFDECFDALVEQFPDFGDLELHQDEKAGSDNGHGSERQFGYCMDGKPIRVAFVAKTEKLPVANIRGLMAHEFGHALDYRYGDELGKMLGQRLPAGVERRADAIAKAVFGRTIKYDDRDIQCVACQGKSVRPRRLGP